MKKNFDNNEKTGFWFGLLIFLKVISIIFLAAAIFIGIPVTVIIWAFHSCNSTESTTTTGSFSARNDAWVYTQFLVERHLKSPKSARFEYGGVERVKETGPGIFIVRSYVDAKNSFGTDIRQYFFCKLQRKSDGKFEVIQLTFE